MKRKLLTFVLAAAMVLSMPTALFATEAKTSEPAAVPASLSQDITISPMSVNTINVGASRKSSTSGSVSAYASFNAKATTAKCTITLQEKYNGSWRTATGIPVISYIKTASGVYSISASRAFTLKSGKVYRAKVTFSDSNSGGSYSTTRYTGSF